MPTCDVCGNDYDKAFSGEPRWPHDDFRQLRMRDPRNGTDLRPLQL